MPECPVKSLPQQTSILSDDKGRRCTIGIAHQQVAPITQHHDQHRGRARHTRPDAMGETTHAQAVTVTNAVRILACLLAFVFHAQ
ncbi:MAG: hypothetical protein ACREX8_06155 [Gammaproteobacteria bacterium]